MRWSGFRSGPSARDPVVLDQHGGGDDAATGDSGRPMDKVSHSDYMPSPEELRLAACHRLAKVQALMDLMARQACPR